MSGIMSMLLGAVSSAAAAVDEFFNRVTLLLPGNGTNGAQNNTFLDSSTNNFTITRNGNTTQGTFSPFSQTGWSNFFGGNGNYAVSNAAVFTSSTSTFTIEGWIYPTAAAVSGSNIPSVIGDMQPTSTAAYWTFGILASGALSFYWYDGASKSATSNGTVSLNTWTHIAVSVNANAITLYINGVQQTLTGTTTLTNRTGSNSSVAFAQFSNTGSVFTGYLSNISVLSGTAKYSTSFTPTTTPLATDTTNQVLLFASGNRFADFNTATTAKTFTITGTPSVQAFSPFAPTAAYSAATVGGSGYFDGSGDYLVSGATSVGANNFTIEFWIYPTSFASTSYPAYSTSSGSKSDVMAFEINTSGVLVAYVTQAGGGAWSIISAGNIGTLTRNAWNHVAFVRNGTAWRGYVNGVAGGLSTTSSATVETFNGFSIGAIANNTGYITGYISGFREVVGTAVYTAAFTPPTAPPTAITNTALLLNYTNAGITDATAKNVLETVGNAQISTTQSKFGGSSMYFDGTGDQLVMPASENFEFGSGNFTVECWVYISGTSGSIINYSNGQTSNANFCWEIYQSSSTVVQATIVEGSTVYSASSSSFSLNAWNHVAAVRNGNTLTIYVNGTAGGTTANVTGVSISRRSGVTVKVSGYNNATGMITGYVDDLRITKGHARYTANFTAPTAAFALQ